MINFPLTWPYISINWIGYPWVSPILGANLDQPWPRLDAALEAADEAQWPAGSRTFHAFHGHLSWSREVLSENVLVQNMCCRKKCTENIVRLWCLWPFVYILDVWCWLAAQLTPVSSPQPNSWLGALAESSGGVPAWTRSSKQERSPTKNNFTCTGAQVHVAYLKVIVDAGCVFFKDVPGHILLDTFADLDNFKHGLRLLKVPDFWVHVEIKWIFEG